VPEQVHDPLTFRQIAGGALLGPHVGSEKAISIPHVVLDRELALDDRAGLGLQLRGDEVAAHDEVGERAVLGVRLFVGPYPGERAVVEAVVLLEAATEDRVEMGRDAFAVSAYAVTGNAGAATAVSSKAGGHRCGGGPSFEWNCSLATGGCCGSSHKAAPRAHHRSKNGRDCWSRCGGRIRSRADRSYVQ